MNMHVAAEADMARVEEIIDGLKHLEGPLLPILHEIQREFGCVPDSAKPVIARALNLSRAEVHGVVSFYHDFRDHPSGRHVLKLCRAEACQSLGGEPLGETIKARLGIDWHETTADGAVTLEPVFCLGLCACAPAAMLDGELHGRLDEHCLDDLLMEARR
ncbi:MULTISPECIES: formate dehydrogenase subunit gamma [Rhizobium/Agrobacterium group]|uniref:formate dehydrogenase subunit gamma n=1 Tax=Rhizobium/Agrobacterium group TaxID=227290 RepID=UPI000B3FE0A6|nr:MULTISPECIES: formate dehydrogenase subunit gamma [Rhizobium/Agrobacterium group]MCF1484278.1 formate dehydrogenase subunit gamma [Allorhizobium ampelinum]NSZ44090.1 formate dehydrogenase subunit gamma [Agrobacterium vitis]NTA27838.1 formate dehydrogenase subunit gamma [Allorhizobium ampelinum]OVE93835.1 formate dehydrogenase subunit gamma [Allorhizobium ampelinum]